MIKNTSLPFHVLIPAAGNATRMGDQVVPKPYLKVMDRPILRHTIEKFLSFEGLKSISVIIQPGHEDLYRDAVHGLKLPPPITGGKTRKQSVFNGLKNISNTRDDDLVLIHDAARPLVQVADIQNLIKVMQNDVLAATLATSVNDTLVRENGNIVQRDGLWAIQTPQAFQFGSLMEAHEKFQDDDSFTDDTGLVSAMGHKVIYVPASPLNIKITTPADFDMLNTMIEAQYSLQNSSQENSSHTEIRTASGFDVHAFEKDQSERPLILGGVQIQHKRALKGHSDADLVLHAITDAILGTINAGDIGTHFPPSDPQWKDADSVQFLEYARKLLDEHHGQITFIDVTIMGEEPKIGPHRAAMQLQIAEILNLSPKRVSVKATTTEKLGFTGRGEGLACQALATVTLAST